jgi:hypothetical protein
MIYEKIKYLLIYVQGKDFELVKENLVSIDDFFDQL